MSLTRELVSFCPALDAADRFLAIWRDVVRRHVSALPVLPLACCRHLFCQLESGQADLSALREAVTAVDREMGTRRRIEDDSCSSGTLASSRAPSPADDEQGRYLSLLENLYQWQKAATTAARQIDAASALSRESSPQVGPSGWSPSPERSPADVCSRCRARGLDCVRARVTARTWVCNSCRAAKVKCEPPPSAPSASPPPHTLEDIEPLVEEAMGLILRASQRAETALRMYKDKDLEAVIGLLSTAAETLGYVYPGEPAPPEGEH